MGRVLLGVTLAVASWIPAPAIGAQHLTRAALRPPALEVSLRSPHAPQEPRGIQRWPRRYRNALAIGALVGVAVAVRVARARQGDSDFLSVGEGIPWAVGGAAVGGGAGLGVMWLADRVRGRQLNAWRARPGDDTCGTLGTTRVLSCDAALHPPGPAVKR